MDSTTDKAGAAIRSVLFVHAHPGDESLGTDATMARYAADGMRVALVTCTRGDENEIAIPGLAHLASDRDDRLGEHCLGELAEAVKLLGIGDRNRPVRVPGAMNSTVDVGRRPLLGWVVVISRAGDR